MTKKKFLSAVLIMLPTVFVFCLCFYYSGNVLMQLPNNITQMNYNLKSKNLPLSIKDMEKLTERISFSRLSFCAELDTENINEEIVTPVLINEYYFEIYGQTLKGDIITKENIDNKDKIAVISSGLALDLFFNTDAIGNTITLNDEIYTICGIIQESENIINSISGDGKQRIYIPYTSYSGFKNCDINAILYDNSASSAPLIEQMNLSQYHATNFSDKAKVIKNFEHILFFILFIALCFISIRLWYRTCKKLMKDIKKDIDQNYFLESLKSIPHKYTLLIIMALSIPAVLLVVFLLLDFSIFIIPKYIPYDNIFDVSYYISSIVENSNIVNSLALSGDTFLINLYSNSFILLVCLLIIFIILSITFFVIVNAILDRMILFVQEKGQIIKVSGEERVNNVIKN